MMSQKWMLVLGLVLFATLCPQVSVADAVCTERLLRMELKQDLADNGILDCSRVNPPAHFKSESIDEQNRRLAAQWDTDCSFESDSNWPSQLGLNLVDATGELVSANDPDQADMCEIMRAYIASGVLGNSDVTSITTDMIEKIDCAGHENQSEICAVSEDAFYQKGSWTILFGEEGISIAGQPKFVSTYEEASLTSFQYSSDILSTVSNAAEGLLGSVSSLFGDDSESDQKGIQTEDWEQKYQKISCVNFNNDNQWHSVSDLSTRWQCTEQCTFLMHYSVSSQGNGSHLLTKLEIDQKDQYDTRQSTGNGDYWQSASMVAYQMQGDSKTHEASIQYQTPSGVQACKQDGSEVAAQWLGLTGDVKVHRNISKESSTYQLTAGSSGTFENMSMSVTLSENRSILGFYSISHNGARATMKMSVYVDGTEDATGRSIASAADYHGIFGLFAQDLPSGNHALKVNYSVDQNVQSNPSNWAGFGMTVVELPPRSSVSKTELRSSDFPQSKFSATTDWLAVPSLSLSKTLTVGGQCVIFYSVNLEDNKSSIKTRLTIDGKEAPGSRSQSLGRGQTTLSGTWMGLLAAGDHSVEVDYQSHTEGQWTQSDWQNFSITFVAIAE